MTDTLSPGQKIDLTNCEREPIHVLGNIQPFGFLLAVAPDWMVARASANLQEFVGLAPEAALGRPLVEIFSEKAVHAIRNRVTLLRGVDAVERLFGIALTPGGAPFDVAVHFSGKLVVIEAEPAVAEEMEASAMVRAMIARVGQADSFAAFLREGARQVRALTGFDRVKVYRFDEQGSGEVIAEALRPGVDSFLGMHYPASDIPPQARTLYLRNIFRVISDIHAVPVPVLPSLDDKGQPLDLSLSVLRAVSPIHIEYLKNMGVKASLSISIIVEGRLWGLFACHHYAPRLPSFAYRTAAELFGQMFSLMLESRERRESAHYESKARTAIDRMMATMAQDVALLDNPQWLGEMVMDTIPSDGVGVCLDGAVALSGLAPGREAFGQIVALLNQKALGQVFTTDSIQTLIPDAAAYADRAAGMIAIPLSLNPRDYVVLFRSEQLRSVRWAGNPEKAVEVGPLGDRLTPRKSFELWSQLVKGLSLPFTAAERRVAEGLRIGMLDVLVRLSDAAGAERARANERQELLIAELNHRVRNILALIRGLISQSRGNAENVEGFIATLDDRIKAMARAHDLITADRWGPARLSDMLETETAAYLGAKRVRVAFDGPNLLIQPAAFTSLALVFHELTTNAAKYGALSDNGTVSVGWKLDEGGDLLIDWEEKGGPAVIAPTRRGFGSTVIERAIPFDLGGKADIAYPVTGLHARFTVPARHIAGLAGTAAAAPASAGDAAVPRPLEGRNVLLVEDSMIIAMDAEDALKEIGAARVVVAANVARAMTALEKGGLDFALLDLNLGAENSLPVADMLTERKIAFAFATGYGEDAGLDNRYHSVLALKKPYTAGQLRQALAGKV
ncbi:MAG: HWE histidine kinase domain-containing protein [Alphaproteobacteria bacterium]